MFAHTAWLVVVVTWLQHVETAPSTDDNNGLLFLTPYIESKNIEEGRKLAEVTGLGWNIKSYSGLLTVNKTCGSNMFFWYFPSERKPSKVPLLIWLNGFSTASSYGIFLQNGPFDLLHGDNLVPRNASWQKYYHVVYIDNPVGVGFSYTKPNDYCYSKTSHDVSLNLISALDQFLKLFPNLSSLELYITGLSLGGKYVSAMAYKIFKQKLYNLKGIFLGNPILEPTIQLNYGPYLYELGFVDKNGMAEINKKENQVKENIKHNRLQEAYEECYNLFLRDDSYIINLTGIDTIYNYNFPYINPDHYFKYIKSKKVKDAVHVGNMMFNDGVTAMSKSADFFLESVAYFLQEMVEDIKIFFYAGQFDVICGYPMLVDVISSLDWSGRSSYNNASRTKLYVEDGKYVWGYLKNFKTLTDVMVRKGSHSVISEQPERILSLLFNLTDYNRFI